MHDRIGRWLLQERLGSGTYGTTWRAVDEDGRAAALKVLPEPPGDELRALSSVCHPAVVTLLDGGGAPVPYLAMELARGRSLTDILRWQQPTEHQAAEVIAVLADALATVHHAGVVHGDVKPDNIIVETLDPARVWLVDFGLALRGEGGTALYAAPELLRGRGGAATLPGGPRAHPRRPVGARHPCADAGRGARPSPLRLGGGGHHCVPRHFPPGARRGAAPTAGADGPRAHPGGRGDGRDLVGAWGGHLGAGAGGSGTYPRPGSDPHRAASAGARVGAHGSGGAPVGGGGAGPRLVAARWPALPPPRRRGPGGAGEEGRGRPEHASPGGPDRPRRRLRRAG
ncbi:MAG: protein kinase [Deltaproteobacteria bacterium]|nr:protein kinase [Deltaproteobacteria bacterium]